MRRILSILSFTVITLSYPNEKMMAQAVKISGEIRTRSEMRDGFQKPIGSNDSATVATNMRTRLNMSYTSNVMKAKITLQDTRTFGQTAPGVAATGNTSIYEAWGEYLIAPGISAAIGRQALEYDDKRIFSASNWSNTGNAHDVLLLKYTSLGFTAHLGSAWNSAKDENTDKSVLLSSGKQYYKNLNYLWMTKSIGDIGASAIWVNEGLQKDTLAKNGGLLYNNYRNTVGGNIWMNNTSIPVNFYLTGYYQFGHQYNLKSKLTQQIDAFMLAGKVQGRINKMLALSVGEDYYSGSSTTIAKNKTNTFNKLYGTNHSFNGSMEYWTTPPASGLSDLYFGIEAKPLNKLKAEATFHKFSYAKKPKTGNKDLGSELDITLSYDVSPEVSLQGGYSAYFVTDALKTAKVTSTFKVYDTNTPQWAYLMITFKPTFLSAK